MIDMSKKRAVVNFEGNQKQCEQAIHELIKFVSEADAQPELTATLQTSDVETDENGNVPEATFEAGGVND